MQKLLSRILCALFLSGCATTPPDVPVCLETGMSSGFCTYTISDKDVIVDEKSKLEGKTWWEMRPYMIQVPPSSWEKIKKYIIVTCKKYPDTCQNSIHAWERKANRIDEHIGGGQ